MVHQKFVEHVIEVTKKDNKIHGLALGGSWITNEIDEFSDIDMILVTKEKISSENNKMIKYAEKFGNLLSYFTGEHVGERRLLICMITHFCM